MSISGKSTGTRVASTSSPKKPGRAPPATKGGGGGGGGAARPQQPNRAAAQKTNTPSSSTTNIKKKPVVVAGKIAPSKSKSIKEMAEERLQTADQYNNQEKVIVRFNHYRKEFPLHNRVLRWCDVDEEYAMSYVYKGNYTRRLFKKKGPDERDSVDGDTIQYEKSDGQYFLLDTFSSDNKEYWLEVIEDEIAGCGIEGLTIREGPIIASRGLLDQGSDVKSGNFAVNEITKQLKSMDVTALHNDEAKRLREARDIEDILYT